MKFSVNESRPCGSLKKYKKCCKPFHDKITFPKTALELMKSRYSAFAVANSDYIIFTTHQNNPDFTTDLKSWTNDILNFSIGFYVVLMILIFMHQLLSKVIVMTTHLR